jgi:lysophospholipase L1-like esterase
MIARAHIRGIKVVGATLTPYEGAGYYSEPGEGIRTAVNQWIRTTGMLDGMVDFDLATRDPENPRKFRPGFNIRDNLHPNDAGYKAMAESIDLSLFGVKKR